MPKLHPHKQLQPNKQIIADILKAYDLTLRSFRVLPGGIENTTVRVITHHGISALRIYQKNKKTIKDIEQELLFMDFLRTAKIPIPSVYTNTAGKRVTRYTHDGAVWSCILMEFAQGNHPKTFSHQTIKHLATLQARMHVLGSQFVQTIPAAKLFWTHLRERAFSPHIKISTVKNAAIKDFVLRAKKFEAILPKNLPQGYNHLDITHDNILIQHEQVTAILDFDDACYSPPIVCLGFTLWDILYITGKTEAVFEYLSIYEETRSLNKNEIRVLKNVLLFRNYIIGALEVYFHGEKGTEVKAVLKLERIINEFSLARETNYH